ncbi:Hsp20/alpha crystallin family protein [Salirhabdus salicampi]|uniref:Hsp20/alpha crystallin family protein n=1 Tax=Salirhabdus salicampi TaxID=476102 RepID=UPI0020C34AFF|nr:Hsp20/alpha crystallin family protein [Salirhabdus salicampi]MCP8615332.1 Hsp20/alpha crystallin family protein [Salirhabdus salicampi]
MSLIPHDFFRQLDKIQRDFHQFFSQFEQLTMNKNNFGFERIDVQEDDDNIIVTLQIQGLDKEEDVSVTVDGHVLTIKGELETKLEVEEKNGRKLETTTKSFQHTVTLPSPVKDKTKTSYENGILKIKLEKI